MSPCPTSRTGTLGVPGNYVHKLLGMAEGWKSPPARCCRSRRCCPRRRSRTEEFQKFRWGRSPPHLLGGGGAILIWTEIDAEGGEKCGQRKEEEKNVCISACDRCIPRWRCNRSKVVGRLLTCHKSRVQYQAVFQLGWVGMIINLESC